MSSAPVDAPDVTQRDADDEEMPRVVITRRRELFAGGAAQMYAVFDLGLIGYWAVPTAPPWFAAEQGVLGQRQPSVTA